MFEKQKINGTKEEKYAKAGKQLEALIKDEKNMIANLSNASAFLNYFLSDINWVGFYLYDEDDEELVLGPFQGLPACIRIPIGKGVCGAAAKNLSVVRVQNVHEFPGHIACDSASNSEIVLPIIKDGKLFAVLDIDSPSLSRFDADDEKGLREMVHVIEENI